MKKLYLLAMTLLAFTSVSAFSNQTKMYALDCGQLEVPDISAFSKEGLLEKRAETLAIPCFLIRHPKGNLLWDLGYHQSLADKAEGEVFYGSFKKSMKTRLTDQLSELSLTPDDIDYIAISHFHDDHIGNAYLFSNATFIVQQQEHAVMFSEELRANQGWFGLYKNLEKSDTKTFDKQIDVFGDGAVTIYHAPGHTKGSAFIKVQLQESGAIMLTGDLYTHERARKLNTIPPFSDDVNAVAKSRKLFESLAKQFGARVITQHSMADFKSLPKFPKFLN